MLQAGDARVFHLSPADPHLRQPTARISYVHDAGKALAVQPHMDTLAERFEALMDDKRVRVGGIIVSVLVLVVSMGLLAAAKGPLRRIEVGKVLPDVAPQLMVLRASPYTEVRVAELRKFLPVPMAKVPAAASAQGRTMLSRR